AESQRSTAAGRMLTAVGLSFDHLGALPSLALRAAGLYRDLPVVIPRAFKKAYDDIDALVYGHIRRRRLLPDQPTDILGLLLNFRLPNGEGLSDKHVRDQVLMLVATGHDTMTSTLTFALNELLVRRPDVQGSIRDEFRASAMSGDLDHSRFPVALAALKETMRLYPALHVLAREAV